MKIRAVLLVRSKAKPEILKHGGNRGKNQRENLRGFGCNVDRTFSSARKIAADLPTSPREILRFFLRFFPPFPPCFKISGFVFCRFPRKASSPPRRPSPASIAFKGRRGGPRGTFPTRFQLCGQRSRSPRLLRR